MENICIAAAEGFWLSESERKEGYLMKTLWTDYEKIPRFPTLEKDLRTSVLIIGGGMTGILCAYFLQQAGVDYCLLEKDTICSGITAGTTAKITAQHGLIYQRLLKWEGLEKAQQYYRANQLAVKHYRDMGWFIDCDMEEKDSYVYTTGNPVRLEREMRALERIGGTADYVAALPLPIETTGAVHFPGQAQFHPLKFAVALAKNLHIYEHSQVREMTEYFALTPTGSVAAEKIIVATHFPFINTRGNYYLKLYQQRSHVLALANAPDVGGMYVDEAPGGLSFRNVKGLLLFGGGSHRTGKPVKGVDELAAQASACLPEAEIVAQWGNQDCMSLDGMPYIGRYSSSTPDLFVATGYNKWGMTGSMLAAMILTDLVQEKENEFAGLFSPGRTIIRPQLAANIGQAMKGILTLGGTRRCSHMGCHLRWNAKENAWECPCHGSRFDDAGEVLDNPATDKILTERMEK